MRAPALLSLLRGDRAAATGHPCAAGGGLLTESTITTAPVRGKSRGDILPPHLRGVRAGAVLSLFIVSTLFVGGCNGNAQTKALKTAADIQKAAAGAYAEAKAEEAVTVKACLVATAPNTPDPTNGQAFAAACAAAGAPLRYDPDKLHDAGKPVLGLYDAVKAARAGVDGAWASVIAYVAALLSDTEIVKLPPGVIDLGRALLGGAR